MEKTLPSSLTLASVMDACLISRQSARFADPWEVYQLLDKALRAEYGPPAFRQFDMPSKPSVTTPIQ